jgi:hypothetical protein
VTNPEASKLATAFAGKLARPILEQLSERLGVELPLIGATVTKVQFSTTIWRRLSVCWLKLDQTAFDAIVGCCADVTNLDGISEYYQTWTAC